MILWETPSRVFTCAVSERHCHRLVGPAAQQVGPSGCGAAEASRKQHAHANSSTSHLRERECVAERDSGRVLSRVSAEMGLSCPCARVSAQGWAGAWGERTRGSDSRESLADALGSIIRYARVTAVG
jgi:hypothetical protein